MHLLSDTSHQTCEAYGVWGVDPQWGPMVKRQTFVVGPDGKIAKHWEKVTPAGHAAEVLAAL